MLSPDACHIEYRRAGDFLSQVAEEGIGSKTQNLSSGVKPIKQCVPQPHRVLFSPPRIRSLLNPLWCPHSRSALGLMLVVITPKYAHYRCLDKIVHLRFYLHLKCTVSCNPCTNDPPTGQIFMSNMTVAATGTEALEAELLKDQGRLWTRNLGRDDRCIADHGREARFPFLDAALLAYIR